MEKCEGRLFTAEDNKKQYYICAWDHGVIQMTKTIGTCPLCDRLLNIVRDRGIRKISTRRTISFSDLDELILLD